MESQKILGGGNDAKREMVDTPQRSQGNSAFKNSPAPPEKAAAPANTNASQDSAEMSEDLDSYFEDV